MALVDAPPLLEHVIRLGSAGVRGAVSIDIGADVGEEVCTIARLADGGCETLEFATVVLEDFAVAGEVVLFQGRGCEGGFGVEETGELGDEGVTLFGISFGPTEKWMCLFLLYALVREGLLAAIQVAVLLRRVLVAASPWRHIGRRYGKGLRSKESGSISIALPPFLDSLYSTCVSSERACCRS